MEENKQKTQEYQVINCVYGDNKVKGFHYDKKKHDGTVTFVNGHYHNMYEIYYLTGGNCRYFIEGKFCDVEQGDIVLIPKAVTHKVIYNGTPTERHLVNFSDEYIDDIFKDELSTLFENGFYRPKSEQNSLVLNIFERISAEFKRSDKLSKTVLKGYISELITLMIRTPSKADATTEFDIPIEKTTQYIIEHFCEDITLEQMAKKAALSASYYSRRFKSLTGFGFKEYLTLIRIKEAQKKLIDTDKSIVKIAYECGFNDSNYFSTVFKKQCKMSPLKYRKQLRIKI